MNQLPQSFITSSTQPTPCKYIILKTMGGLSTPVCKQIFIVSENLFNEINLFEVGNHLSDLSDHSKISCHIKRIKHKTEQLHCDNLKLESVPLGYIWHNERYIEALNSNMTEREVTQFLFKSGEKC